MTGCPANNSPIARALGDDFINLHTAVRKHYSEPTVVVSGVMDCWQSAQVGQIRTREGYYYEELRGSSLRVLL